MRWPRGRYNGARIIGLDWKIRINIVYWALSWPNRYGRAFMLGPLHVWPAWLYDFTSEK